jgi:GT2 family glycosyltransferase
MGLKNLPSWSYPVQTDLLVVNYNTKDKLQRLLDILHSDVGDEQVWKLYVADNNSTDGSREWLKDHGDKYNIETVFMNPNVGYSEAINNMSTVCDSEILCAVNADTWFDTKHVKAAAQTFVDNPLQGIMGPKQLDEQGRIRHAGIFWDKQSDPVHRGWAHPDPEDKMFKTRDKCWTVSGSIYYVRRSTWDAMTSDAHYRSLFPRVTGAMLPTFMYFEETWTSIFADFLGWDIYYDGTLPTAGHSWHASNTPGDNTGHFHTSRQLYRMTADRIGVRHEIK